MKKQRTNHSFAALSLAALVMQAVLLKEAHVHLSDHHDAILHCTTGAGEKHIHSEEYAHPECSICLFHFSPTPLDFYLISISVPLAIRSERMFFYQNPAATRLHDSLRLRGPPVLSA